MNGTSRTDRLLLHGMMLVVTLAPLPLGANREWAWTLCATLLGLIALLAGVREAWRPGAPPAIALRWGGVLFLGVAAWAAVQVSPTTPEPWHHPAWRLAAETLAEALPGAVSVSTEDGWSALLRLLSYGLAFCIAWRAGRDPGLARTATSWLLVAAMAYAAYGLAVYWSRSGTLLWLQQVGWEHDVRGTFVNRNSFAAWLGLCLLVALGRFHSVATQRRNPAYELPLPTVQRLERFLLRTWRLLAVIAVLAGALVLTHSRGGFLAFCAGALALLACIHLRQPLRKDGSRLVVLGGFLACALVFWLTSEVLLQRIDRLNADHAARLDAYRITLGGVADNPLLGFGYGTYADSFRLYRGEGLEGHFDKAHNTYLENAMELGWPAAAALVLAVALAALCCWRELRRRRQGWIHPATALAATVLVGVHACVDFSLQIPAIAICYAVLLGLGAAPMEGRWRPPPLVYTAAQPPGPTGTDA